MADKLKTVKAVAIKYPEGCEVPFITAKGKGLVAERILDIAREKNIKIEHDDSLVEVLDCKEIGEAIPEEVWKTVANILSFILQNQKK